MLKPWSEMSDREKLEGPDWGYIQADGNFRKLPKTPMVLAALGPPPFPVTLPSGEIRHIIEASSLSKGADSAAIITSADPGSAAPSESAALNVAAAAAGSSEPVIGEPTIAQSAPS